VYNKIKYKFIKGWIIVGATFYHKTNLLIAKSANRYRISDIMKLAFRQKEKGVCRKSGKV
jgi:hypothetical protein